MLGSASDVCRVHSTGGGSSVRDPAWTTLPTAAQGPSPAATEKQQVLHGWGGGVRVLACDEVAVQHDMHRIGLAGCRGPPRTRASGKATRRHGSRPPPALLGL